MKTILVVFATSYTTMVASATQLPVINFADFGNSRIWGSPGSSDNTPIPRAKIIREKVAKYNLPNPRLEEGIFANANVWPPNRSSMVDQIIAALRNENLRAIVDYEYMKQQAFHQLSLATVDDARDLIQYLISVRYIHREVHEKLLEAESCSTKGIQNILEQFLSRDAVKYSYLSQTHLANWCGYMVLNIRPVDMKEYERVNSVSGTADLIEMPVARWITFLEKAREEFGTRTSIAPAAAAAASEELPDDQETENKKKKRKTSTTDVTAAFSGTSGLIPAVDLQRFLTPPTPPPTPGNTTRATKRKRKIVPTQEEKGKNEEAKAARSTEPKTSGMMDVNMDPIAPVMTTSSNSDDARRKGIQIIDLVDIDGDEEGDEIKPGESKMVLVDVMTAQQRSSRILAASSPFLPTPFVRPKPIGIPTVGYSQQQHQPSAPITAAAPMLSQSSLSRFPQVEINMIRKILTDKVVAKNLDQHNYSEQVANHLAHRMMSILGQMPTMSRASIHYVVHQLGAQRGSSQHVVHPPVPVRFAPSAQAVAAPLTAQTKPPGPQTVASVIRELVGSSSNSANANVVPAAPAKQTVASILGDIIRQRLSGSSATPLVTTTTNSAAQATISYTYIPEPDELSLAIRSAIGRILGSHKGTVPARRVKQFLSTQPDVDITEAEATTDEQIQNILNHISSVLTIPAETFSALTAFDRNETPFSSIVPRGGTRGDHSIITQLHDAFANYVAGSSARFPQTAELIRENQLSPFAVAFWLENQIDKNEFRGDHFVRTEQIVSIPAQVGMQSAGNLYGRIASSRIPPPPDTDEDFVFEEEDNTML